MSSPDTESTPVVPFRLKMKKKRKLNPPPSSPTSEDSLVNRSFVSSISKVDEIAEAAEREISEGLSTVEGKDAKLAAKAARVVARIRSEISAAAEQQVSWSAAQWESKKKQLRLAEKAEREARAKARHFEETVAALREEATKESEADRAVRLGYATPFETQMMPQDRATYDAEPLTSAQLRRISSFSRGQRRPGRPSARQTKRRRPNSAASSSDDEAGQEPTGGTIASRVVLFEVPEEVENDGDDQSDDPTTETFRASAASDSADLATWPDDGDDAMYERRLRAWLYAERHAADGTVNEAVTDGARLRKLGSLRSAVANAVVGRGTDSSLVRYGGDGVLPVTLHERLFGYQRTGVRWLWTLFRQGAGGIVGDEMGLGKTVQISAFLALLDCSHQFDAPALVVAPATVMEQWVREIRAWWPPTRAVIFHSSGNSNVSLKRLLRSMQAGSVLITTYAALRSEQARLSAKRWSTIVLDEGHKIRNPDAGITLAAKSFDCARRFILSGAPIQNNLSELWSLVDFVMPGRLGTLPVFKFEFEAPIRAGGFANASLFQVQTAYKCAVALRDAVRPYLLRRVKKDVLKDLPRKTEQVLFCRLTDEQHQMYVSFLSTSVVHDVSSSGRMYVHGSDRYGTSHRDQMQGLRGGGRIVSQGVGRASSGRNSSTGANGSSMFMAIDHLRKLCNHPDLVVDTSNMPEDQTYGDWRRSGKLRVLDELLRIWHREGHKCLVFCQTRQMLDIVESFVRGCGYNHLRMDGNTKIGSRQHLIDRFNKDSDVFCFVLTARVGGLGTNLVGADRLVILDPDWNPSTDMQARERAWRIGQQRNVVIYRLMTAGTIEEKIYHRQIFKQSMTNRILVDPQQRRFLQSAQLGDLFTVPPAPSSSDGPAQGGSSNGRARTETGHLFASLDSEILPEHVARVATRDLEAEEAAELEDQREAGLRVDADEGDEDGDDCRVLQALFQCAKLRSVVRHDAIEGHGDRTAAAMEQAANQVADVEVQRRLAALERSRSQVSGNAVSAPTWTGRSGAAGAPPPRPPARTVPSPAPPQRTQEPPTRQRDPPARQGAPSQRPLEPARDERLPVASTGAATLPPPLISGASALFAPPARKRTGSVAARRAAEAEILEQLTAAHAEPQVDPLEEDPDFARPGGQAMRPAAPNVFAGPTIDLTGSDNDDEADAPAATVAPAGAPSLPRSSVPSVLVSEVTVAQYFREADKGTGLSTAQVAAHFGATSVGEARTLRDALRSVADFDERSKRWKLRR